MNTNLLHEPEPELSVPFRRVGVWAGREGKAVGRKPSMIGRRESDSRVVPAKLANNAGGPAAEPVEERRLDKGNADQQTVPRTQRRDHGTSNALDRLRAAYGALSPSAAAGVDAVTWESYGQDLEVRLGDLHGRVQRGAYRAKPSRRVYIPKADGRLRPLGNAALEDK